MSRPKPLIRTVLEPIGIAVALAMLVRSVAHVYSIPSGSMSPTLRAGDHILVTRYVAGQPRRGDVVVFESPLRPSELLVKRIVGVPGDLVDSRLGRVRIGGYTLAEPYLRRPAASGAIEPRVVAADAYFVLGDNREDSIDSRSWGAIPREAIVGRARMVLWSWPQGSEEARASVDPDASGERVASSHDRRNRLFHWVR